MLSDMNDTEKGRSAFSTSYLRPLSRLPLRSVTHAVDACRRQSEGCVSLGEEWYILLQPWDTGRHRGTGLMWQGVARLPSRPVAMPGGHGLQLFHSLAVRALTSHRVFVCLCFPLCTVGMKNTCLVMPFCEFKEIIHKDLRPMPSTY